MPTEDAPALSQGNWSFPGLSRKDLIGQAQSIIDLIEEGAVDDVDGHDIYLQDYARRLTFLQQNTVPQLWSGAAQAMPAFTLTMDGLRSALKLVLKQDERSDVLQALKRVGTQIRSMEATLKALQPRTVALSNMVERIEQAHSAADQLPTELEALAEAQSQVAANLSKSSEDCQEISRFLDSSRLYSEKLISLEDEANKTLESLQTAYSAATSVGLAAAFTERSENLSKSIRYWVGGLVVALCAGSYFGAKQLHDLSEILKVPDTSSSVILFNFVLAVLSVGAPVWFAWLSTKQIGQRFRLAEDYAFKASVSRAYEGFRREAARFDKDMEARLLSSALTRFDELPLRLVETESHGSPWQELATSPAVKQAISTVPDFMDRVKALASSVTSQPASLPALSQLPVKASTTRTDDPEG